MFERHPDICALALTIPTYHGLTGDVSGIAKVCEQRGIPLMVDAAHGGVPVFDSAAAQLMIRLARSVRLLGARTLLVGMSPANARTIVSLGVDLQDIETHATCKTGSLGPWSCRR